MKIKTAFLKLSVALLILAMLPILSQAQSGHKLSSKQGNFIITFPGEPDFSSDEVETAVGNLMMYTYMFEISDDAAYMVAYIDYPKDMVEESDNDVLLEAALNGALDSWGIDLNKVVQETTWHSGYKGIYCKESNGNTYTAYEVILVENRLYQIAILQYGKSISQKALSSFFESFKLKE